MFPRALTIPVLAVAVAFTLGCGSKPPPPPEEPKIEAPPPPKPKPKCIELDEKCEAKEDTRAKIKNAELVFTPAAGWVYAQGEDATIAQMSEDGPAIAFAVFEADAKDAKKDIANREAAMEALLTKLNIQPPKKKVVWKKPADTQDVGDLKVSLWQLEGGARAEKKGPLLIIATSVADDKGVLGVGFVPDDDKSGADEAIMKSIESIARHEGSGSSK